MKLKKKATKDFYELNNILKEDAQYNMILGERSNGKSYAVKKYCMEKAWNEEKLFVLLRRYQVEIGKSDCESYFMDCPINEITKGECNNIIAYSGKIYAAKYDSEKNKNTRVKLVGYYQDLSTASHVKSHVYNNVENMIYEEFISEGGDYLGNEPIILQSFISTVFRRRTGKIWMIGNTISRICPYFNSWGLVNIPKQKQGTIEIYNVTTQEIDEETDKPIIIKIAVEFAENAKYSSSKMFFGSSADMITTGVWQSEQQPHLNKRESEYYVNHTIYFKHSSGFNFQLDFLTEKEGTGFTWYVKPKTTKIPENVRLVSDMFNFSPLYTPKFTGLNDKENKILRYLHDGRVCFSTDLTGTDFWNCYKSL